MTKKLKITWLLGEKKEAPPFKVGSLRLNLVVIVNISHSNVLTVQW